MTNNELKKILPKQEAVSLDTKAERLAILAQSDDPAVQRAVAKNRQTPPEVLEKLSHSSDKAIRKAVAGNPSSPPNTLTSLGAQFPLELLRNPALDWLLLENPGMLSEMPEETQGAIAKREDCTPEILGYLGRAGKGRSLLLALIQNGKTPPTTIRQLYEANTSKLAEYNEVPDNTVRKIQPIAAMHVAMRSEPEFSSAIEEFWSEMVDLGSVEGKLFDAANIPEKIRVEILAWNLLQRQLREDNDSKMLRQASLPIPMLEILAVTTNDKRLLTFIGKLASSPFWLKNLAGAEQAKSAIKENAENSLPELQKLLLLNSPIVNLLLAKHPLAATQVAASVTLQELARDPKNWIREYVATHPETLPETLSELFDEHFQTASCAIERIENEKILLYIAENPNTYPSNLESLGLVDKYEWYDVKDNVARNPSTPASVLSKMAATKDYGVEIGLAENPNTPLELFEKLSKTTDNLICTRLAENPSVPPSVLEMLSKSKDEEVLELLAKNPKTPQSAIALIARTDDDWILESVAVHPNVSAEVLGKLVKNDLIYDEKVLRKIADNPKTPVDALKKLSREDDPLIKRAVATNPNTPTDLLQILCDDDASSVRSAAKKIIKTRNID